MTRQFTSCINEDMDYLCLEQAQTIIRLIKRCETLTKQRDFFKKEFEEVHKRIKKEDTFNFGEHGKYKVTKVDTDD